MGESATNLLTTALLCGAGATAVTILWRAGCFRRDALDKRINPGPGFGWIELLGVFVVLMLSIVVANNAADSLGIPQPPPPATQPDAPPQPATRAATASQPADSGSYDRALRIFFTQSLHSIITAAFVITIAYVRALPSPLGIRRLGLSVIDGRFLANLGIGVIACLLVVPSVFAIMQIITFISAMLGHPPPPIAHNMLHDLRNADAQNARLMLLAAAIIVAPIFEEIVFRGVLHSVIRNTLGDRRRWITIFLTAGVFTLVHLSAIPWKPALIAIFVLGIAFSWLYERTGSLLPSMLVHIAFNAANCVIVMMFGPVK